MRRRSEVERAPPSAEGAFFHKAQNFNISGGTFQVISGDVHQNLAAQHNHLDNAYNTAYGFGAGSFEGYNRPYPSPPTPPFLGPNYPSYGPSYGPASSTASSSGSNPSSPFSPNGFMGFNPGMGPSSNQRSGHEFGFPQQYGEQTRRQSTPVPVRSASISTSPSPVVEEVDGSVVTMPVAEHHEDAQASVQRTATNDASAASVASTTETTVNTSSPAATPILQAIASIDLSLPESPTSSSPSGSVSATLEGMRRMMANADIQNDAANMPPGPSQPAKAKRFSRIRSFLRTKSRSNTASTSSTLVG
ncbi:hypothetical protein MIND_01083500 [Mycena indigotica]|uniref:Uncharacterized protein n=1 Tax=Mycena indigotica TaxID=2126181 RepID=A0A8H6SBT1_9AGAR|nr:uncharacterized protein MIND_01083500 [Mycena indigotica]KAF7295437.1 hypothetical protein MIND_01083500 [Mycena indigotica]